MNSFIRRAGIAGATTAAVVAASSGAAVAHECVNISKKNQAAGVQITFDASFSAPVWISSGLQKRIDAGLVDLESGEGFHGLIGIDLDGDDVADISTFIVGPDGEIPVAAQQNGADCQGIINFEQAFVCMGG